MFYSAAEIVNTNNEEMDSYLGTEVDLVGAYKIRKDLSLGLGYSHMFGSESLEVLKGGDSGRIQNWTWLMVSFNPELFSYKSLKHPLLPISRAKLIVGLQGNVLSSYSFYKIRYRL